ncbi:hypothetical protein M2138_001679 [Dysgonomonadaceae bacterium PH5-43]|nr:hypothetical protein [Dysgonomonadaceae bacterium PH5-43]
MKKFFLCFICVLSIYACNTQSSISNFTKISDTYSKLVEQPNNLDCQQAFFDAFPNSWNEFNITYGYFPEDKYGSTLHSNLYSHSYDHIKALGNLTLIDESLYCEKLVDIAIGGRWDADGPNHFQALLHNTMKSKGNLLFETVTKEYLNTSKVLFWQFYWSSLLKVKEYEEEFNYLYNSNKEKYPQEVETMKAAFDLFHGKVGGTLP